MENKRIRGGFIDDSSSDNTPSLPKIRPASPDDELVIRYPLELNQKCDHCGSVEIDTKFKKIFHVNICDSCKQRYDEDYSLMTKTAAKLKYLLTDEELNDTQILPYLTKPNPHKSTWSDMQLYLSLHLKRFAIEKWGSLEALAKEIEERSTIKDNRREKKFKNKIKELRKKTRTSRPAKQLAEAKAEHIHRFVVLDGIQKRCELCGLKMEEEEF